jgi:shikimate dehydrogenase
MRVMDKYAVIGNPIAHSKSPIIHAQFAQQTGQALSYVALYSEVPDFEAAVRRFRDQGGSGLNVTVPFKHRAYALADVRTDRAERGRSVNTLTFGSSGIIGDNTDGAGLVRDLTHNLRCELHGQRILLMGAGGAAYGVCGPLLEQQPALLIVVNRSVEKAQSLCEHFNPGATSAVLRGCGYGDLSENVFDLVINATSAGLSDTMPPLPTGLFAQGAVAYEMVYGKDTPFLEFALREGARAADGLGMLVEQAAESFYVWRQVRPQTTPVIAHLRGMT